MKEYRIFERTRFAILLTFISGFSDGFSYLTQGERFSGIQTGNTVYLVFHLVSGKWGEAWQYAISIIAFMAGAGATYWIRRQIVSYPKLAWHRSSGLILLAMMAITAILAPVVSTSTTVVCLAFTAAFQLESFKRIKGAPYANIMMTGNIKTSAVLITQGLSEKNTAILKKGLTIFSVVASFALGVFCAGVLVNPFGEYTLYFALMPLLMLNLFLYLDEPKQRA